MYDRTGNNWSHWNSNTELKEKSASYTRNTFNTLFTTILGKSHILRKVLQGETWNLSDGVHRWFKIHTEKKGPVTSDIIIIIVFVMVLCFVCVSFCWPLTSVLLNLHQDKHLLNYYNKIFGLVLLYKPWCAACRHRTTNYVEMFATKRNSYWQAEADILSHDGDFIIIIITNSTARFCSRNNSPWTS